MEIMEKIYKIRDLEFTIEKETGNLIISSQLESWHIPDDEGMDLINALRSDHEDVLYQKEIENLNWLQNIWK